MKESTFFHRYREVILGVAMLALGAFYLYNSTLIRLRGSVNVSVSAKLIPEILGTMVLALGVLQLVGGIKKLREIVLIDKAENNTPVFASAFEKRNAVPVILTFIIILGYVMVFESLGFVVSSTLCMFCQMWVLSPKGKFRPVAFFLISLGVAVIVYIAFRRGLNLSLPPGILQDLPF